MDDSIGAIVVSAITGGFGVIGIWITAKFAKKKAGGSDVSIDTQIMEAMHKKAPASDVDYMAAIKVELRESRLQSRELAQKLTEDLSDMHDTVRHVRTKVDELPYKLRKHSDKGNEA